MAGRGHIHPLKFYQFLEFCQALELCQALEFGFLKLL